MHVSRFLGSFFYSFGFNSDRVGYACRDRAYCLSRTARTPYVHMHGLSFVLASVLLFTAIAFVLPSKAFAKKSYQITSVDIQASINAEGDLRIHEERSFVFHGMFNGVYWKLPFGEYQERHLEPMDIQAFEYRDGHEIGFVQNDLEKDNTYQVINNGATKEVKLYSYQRNRRARFGISYTVPRACFRYEDTSVLYWKFVSDGWDKASQHVTCELSFEDLFTEIAAKDPQYELNADAFSRDVEAWGHGARGEIALQDNKVICKLDEVAPSDFAEMRVIFPSAWLFAAPSLEGKKKDAIEAEEHHWQESAQQELRARQMELYELMVYAAISAGISLVVLAILCLRRHTLLKPDALHKYFRDIPSLDHPSVLSYLYAGKVVPKTSLVAAIMRLCDCGVAKLELVGKTGSVSASAINSAAAPLAATSASSSARAPKPSYRIVCLKEKDSLHALASTSVSRLTPPVPGFEEETQAIDEAVYDLLFATAREGETCTGRVVDLSQLSDEIGAHQELYAKAYDRFESLVRALAHARGFYSPAKTARLHKVWRAMMMLMVVDILSVIIQIVCYLQLLNGAKLSWHWLCVALILFIASIVLALVSAVLTFRTTPISDEALDILHKLTGLKQYLCDFTRLKESVPQDLVLWNKLMIMACVLGIPHKVIAGLKLSCPQMFAGVDTDTVGATSFDMPLYWWYTSSMYDTDLFYSFSSMSDAFASAAQTLETASMLSDLDGTSFSSGGGGGFGGGGGGGAF